MGLRVKDATAAPIRLPLSVWVNAGSPDRGGLA